MEDDAPVEEIEQADSFKEGIYAAMISIEKHCTAPTVVLPTATPTTSTTGLEPGMTFESTHPSRSTHVRLPKLTIRPFNGDITTWTTFWDSYESAIHNNTELSDIDKFNYLKSLLERTGHEAISGLTMTSVKYHEAITILRKRFGNKQQIIR